MNVRVQIRREMINYELDGKVAVVTGGASGIGLACCHALARSGAAVSLWDLNAEALETAVAELEQYGRPTHTAVVDVSDSNRVTDAMEAVANDLGRVDIVVANAGIGGEQKPTAEYTDASWHKVIGHAAATTNSGVEEVVDSDRTIIPGSEPWTQRSTAAKPASSVPTRPG